MKKVNEEKVRRTKLRLKADLSNSFELLEVKSREDILEFEGITDRAFNMTFE